MTSRLAAVAAGLLAAAALAAAVAARAGGDPGPVHVHGLGVDPADRSLVIATHTGMWRVRRPGGKPRRIGDRRQDTMGFTVVGPGRYLGSGHPDVRDRLPGLLGLIESSDGGRSWRTVSLLGEADFHVLEASGRTVYGFDVARGRLLASANRGRTWRARPAPEPLVSLAIAPGRPARLVAAGQRALHRSADGGATWRPLVSGSGLLAWPELGRLYLVAGDGRVWLSRDEGRRWVPAGAIGGQPAAFEASAPRVLFAALHDGTIKRSTDGGRRWRAYAR